ncbi:hypothetical protein [Calditerrivibrio nitroreducens]|uniref:Uncharacterized protein n=1 Tax=Calditerrivibrio nitroreducens (strain DSM 19672 / NBRC 101217 / Yu37-1) TaxID=768670 RepID=E4TJF0_CALNY|nr:hypothetical protein [Calditerrivibrio nitroreducens]ADR19217.1 hypothetical protein Calni_1309 [Calditerrivibrio nitroreducens DSM 19672]
MNKIEDMEKAKRLARTIITDIVLYNQSKVEEGIKNDNIFDILNEEIELGKKLFEEKVNTEIIPFKVFDKILIDILIAKYGGKIESKIW